MKRVIPFTVLSFLLFLSGCIPLGEPKAPTTPQDQTVITPSIPVGEEYYQTLLPYVKSSAEGTYAEMGNRVDADRLELGLMELSQKIFSPSRYILQEGQIISVDDAVDWLARYDASKNSQGLNPASGSKPIVHIYEQDYLDMGTKKLAGLSIAISLNPMTTVTENGKEKEVRRSDEALQGILQEASAKIVDRIRAKGMKGPLLIAGFLQEPSISLVPGHYFVYGTVPANGTGAEWKPFKERYLLYPGRMAKSDLEKQVGANFSDFQGKLKEFFGRYAGAMGLARFVDDQLVEFTVTLETEYSSKTEVLSLTQYIAGLIPQYFPQKAQVNVYIRSVDRPEALYVRPVEGDPLFHIYR
ncbi:MAG: CamS family sex pheromone protein [Thermicanus sp.]|nr:CamS family sex pheromone protein [Thermicanus sp.]